MRPILIAGVLLFTVLTFYSALWFKSEQIEADVTDRVTEGLAAADASDISLNVDGRHVTLSGVVYDAETEGRYLNVANDTYGALGPVDGLTLQTGGGFLNAVKSPEGITLTGAVPSEAARAALLRAASTSTDGAVVDELTVGAPTGAWTDEASFGLGEIAKLSAGVLSITPDNYLLSGVTDADPDTVKAPLAERAGWQSFISAPAAASDLEGNLASLQGTVAERDSTIIALTAERDTLATSLADMARSRDAALAEQGATAAEIIAQRDTLAGQLRGVTARREVLSQTVAGLAAERDGLQQSVATLTAERDTAVTALADLRASLDDTQSDTAALRGQVSEAQTELDAREATIEGLNGQIADLTGQVTALTGQLQNQAATLNSGEERDATLRAQIAELQSGSAALEADVGALNALVAERDATIADLRAAAPATVASDAATRIAAQCGARATEIVQNAQINFSSGTANISGDSVETLERLTGIALACADRGLAVEIGGHTDSEGSDEDNQTLSERRAQSVAQFMIDRGVPAATLAPVGFGEAQPIGDNATVEGRQQNRRISFDWRAR